MRQLRKLVIPNATRLIRFARLLSVSVGPGYDSLRWPQRDGLIWPHPRIPVSTVRYFSQ